MSKRTQRMRQLLKREGAILMPVAHDALTAKIIEKTGFEAFSLGGFGIAASRFGLPDLGLLSFSEMLQATKEIADSASIPMLADADTGYGNHLNVARTVQEYERAGVAALFIEDQVFPKRCGHIDGKQVISAKEMAFKIRAAVASRSDPDFVIVARTDSRTTHSLGQAIYRAELYARAGADVIFIEAPQSVQELEIIPKKIKVPLLVNMLEGGKTPILGKERLEKMGYKLIAWPISSLLAMTKAVEKVMKELREQGTTKGLWQEMADFEDLKELLEIEKFKGFELGLRT